MVTTSPSQPDPAAPAFKAGRAQIIVTLLSLAIPVALAEIYRVLSPYAGSAWIAALAVNATLSVALLVVLAHRRALKQYFNVAPLWSYAPAALVFFGAAALSAFGRATGGATTHAAGTEQWFFIAMVPFIEEILFRAGFGAAFRARAGVLWGGWFAALCFAFVHASPTLSRVFALEIGLPLGPFLLGLICETLVVKSRSLMPAIAFHMACNATVVIFAWGDARWLERLSFLYS